MRYLNLAYRWFCRLGLDGKGRAPSSASVEPISTG
jgi:hypothetical protein